MVSVCNSDQFYCDSNKCIPQSYVRDGDDDCGDYSDERKEIVMYMLNVTIYLQKIKIMMNTQRCVSIIIKKKKS